MPELTGILFRAGPAMADDAKITAQELTAWASGTGVTLSGWEFETILDLSASYVMQRYLSRKPSCPPPWTPAKIDRVKVAADVRRFLRE